MKQKIRLSDLHWSLKVPIVLVWISISIYGGLLALGMLFALTGW